jgi:hypothetical protein
MFPSAHFKETALGAPEHEKCCIDISHAGRIGMHYVTCKSNRMQKHKFGVTYPSALFMETALGPPKYEK